MTIGKKLILKILKITGITIVSILGLLFILPMIFGEAITEKVKIIANENLEGELNF